MYAGHGCNFQETVHGWERIELYRQKLSPEELKVDTFHQVSFFINGTCIMHKRLISIFRRQIIDGCIKLYMQKLSATEVFDTFCDNSVTLHDSYFPIQIQGTTIKSNFQETIHIRVEMH